MKCGHVIDTGRNEEGNPRLLEIAAASEEPAGKLPNAALNVCVGEGIVTFDQGNLVGPVAIQHVVHSAQSMLRQTQSTAKSGKRAVSGFGVAPLISRWVQRNPHMRHLDVRHNACDMSTRFRTARQRTRCKRHHF